MATYRKNFITQAVFQVDFNPIQTQSFINFIANKWDFNHKRGQQEVRTNNFQFSNEEFSSRINTWIVWVCDDNDWLKIEVWNTYILIVFDTEEYKNQEIITKEFNFINAFIEHNSIEVLNRIYIRYINEFNAQKLWINAPTNRSKFIKDELLSPISVWGEYWDLRRAMTQTLSVEDWYMISTKYWLWNNQFPWPVTDFNFILDLEVRSQFPIEWCKDVWDYFKKYKEKNNMIFENSIKEDLRDFLNKDE